MRKRLLLLFLETPFITAIGRGRYKPTHSSSERGAGITRAARCGIGKLTEAEVDASGILDTDDRTSLSAHAGRTAVILRLR